MGQFVGDCIVLGILFGDEEDEFALHLQPDERSTRRVVVHVIEEPDLDM